MKRIVLLLCTVSLIGCSTHQSSWNDTHYLDAMEIGKSIFSLGQLKQAEQHYHYALARATMANDLQSIHDAGFNVAAVQMKQGHYSSMNLTLEQCATALRERGWQPSSYADFSFLSAEALFQQRQWTGSFDKVQEALFFPDEGTQEEAYALYGLDASFLGKNDSVQRALAYLSHRKSHSAQLNALELKIHILLRQRQWQLADKTAQTLAIQRQVRLEYSAMRRALELQKEALLAEGHESAARDIQQQIHESLQAGNAAY